MKNSQITTIILGTIAVGIALVLYFAMNDFASDVGGGWAGIISSSWPFVLPAIVIAYFFTSYKGLKGWITKNRALAIIFISMLLYILSLFFYAHAMVFYGLQ